MNKQVRYKQYFVVEIKIKNYVIDKEGCCLY